LYLTKIEKKDALKAENGKDMCGNSMVVEWAKAKGNSFLTISLTENKNTDENLAKLRDEVKIMPNKLLNILIIVR
jgi:hypothetical protein